MQRHRIAVLALLAAACFGLPACSAITGADDKGSSTSAPDKVADKAPEQKAAKKLDAASFCAKLKEQGGNLVPNPDIVTAEDKKEALEKLQTFADIAPDDIQADFQAVVDYWKEVFAGTAQEDQVPREAVTRVAQWQSENCGD